MDGWNRGNVYGSYVHGLFDSPGIAQAVIQALADKKGLALEDLDATDYRSYREKQYDKLAEALRKSLDMEKLYDIIGIKNKP